MSNDPNPILKIVDEFGKDLEKLRAQKYSFESLSQLMLNYLKTLMAFAQATLAQNLRKDQVLLAAEVAWDKYITKIDLPGSFDSMIFSYFKPKYLELVSTLVEQLLPGLKAANWDLKKG